MLKISEFATAAKTTRRTLILYDKNDLFKPALVNNEGYRFYDYEQIHELSFIQTLKNLGLSIDEIKQINANDKTDIASEVLLNLKSKVHKQIRDLVKVNTALTEKNNYSCDLNNLPLYQPYEHINDEALFWKSTNLDDCTPQVIAKAFSEFYSHLERFMGVSANCSGFLIDLPNKSAETLANTSFALIKEATIPVNDNSITTVKRPAGNYIAIDVNNDNGHNCENIRKGVDILIQMATDSHLTIDDKLWQINFNKDVRSPNATSNIIRLEFEIK